MACNSPRSTSCGYMPAQGDSPTMRGSPDRSLLIAGILGVVAGLAWLVKVGLIYANGGTNTSSGPVAAMYLVGFIGLLLAAGAGGWALLAGRPAWQRALGAIAGLVLAFGATQVVDTVAKGIYRQDGWFRGEVSILLLALVALALGSWALWRARA